LSVLRWQKCGNTITPELQIYYKTIKLFRATRRKQLCYSSDIFDIVVLQNCNKPFLLQGIEIFRWDILLGRSRMRLAPKTFS